MSAFIHDAKYDPMMRKTEKHQIQSKWLENQQRQQVAAKFKRRKCFKDHFPHLDREQLTFSNMSVVLCFTQTMLIKKKQNMHVENVFA